MDKARYLNRVEGHALVLGGSGGLGSEIVRALAASGASALAFTYGRNKTAADKLVAELKDIGLKAHAAPVDQSDEVAFKQFLDDAARRFPLPRTPSASHRTSPSKNRPSTARTAGATCSK